MAGYCTSTSSMVERKRAVDDGGGRATKHPLTMGRGIIIGAPLVVVVKVEVHNFTCIADVTGTVTSLFRAL